MSSSLRWLLCGVSGVVVLLACSAKGGQQCVGDDLPDPMGEDSNCDGIDGNLDQAIFVSPLGMDTNPGTREQPLKTIHGGLAMAAAKKKTQVLVAGADYDEGDTLQFPDKLGLYGGYDKTNWTRPGAATNVRVAKPLALEARGIMGPSTIARITITAADNTAVGGASIGIRLVSVQNLTINDDATIAAGRGGPGAAGEPGVTGATGNPGKPGGGGNIDSQSSPGSGGGGGDNPTCAEANGASGGGGGRDPNFAGVKGSDSTLGALGGAGGSTSGCTPVAGTDGSPFATDGEKGIDGMGAGAVPKLDTMTYALLAQDGQDGTDGKPGAGGGGGGGSSGQTGTFCVDGAGNGGGGGGAGGCGGTAGKGGKGGGASIAILAITSPVILDGATLQTAGGGAGGAGGTGGMGGGGGMGQIGGTVGFGEIGKPGNGADGKAGGSGGSGGGGGGGASIGVWTEGGMVPKLMRVSYKLGDGGMGGACGAMTCAGQPGAKKESGP
jgi:hypothetical protein